MLMPPPPKKIIFLDPFELTFDATCTIVPSKGYMARNFFGKGWGFKLKNIDFLKNNKYTEGVR